MNAFQYISTSPLCKSDSDCDISSICCGVTSLDHSICVPLNYSDLVVLGYGGRTSEVNPALSLPIPRPIPVPPLLASLTSVSPPKSPNYIYAPNARYKWYNLNVQTLFSYQWWKKNISFSDWLTRRLSSWDVKTTRLWCMKVFDVVCRNCKNALKINRIRMWLL